MPTPKVVVEAAQMRALPTTAVLVGTVDAVRRSRVGAEVAGAVVRMPVRQGDRVETGQLLCKLNDELVGFQLAQAKARLESLKARHEELLAGTRRETLDRLKALLDEAEAIRRLWSFEVDRVRALYADADAGSQKEVYDAEAQLASAEQRKVAARATYEEARNGPRKQTIAQARFDVAEQQAVVGRLERELGKTEIRAPFAGYVIRRSVEVGEWVSAGVEVVTIADLSTVLVRVDVPEFAMPYCRVGDAARVHVDALRKTFEGTIKHRVPQADVNARTFPVDVEVDNPDGQLGAGMFARVTIPAGPDARSIAVPTDAVVERSGTSYVVIVTPGRRGPMGAPMPVTTGADVGGWVAITSPNVQPGMHVIVRGNERIVFPRPVEIVDQNGTPVAWPPGGGDAPPPPRGGGTGDAGGPGKGA